MMSHYFTGLADEKELLALFENSSLSSSGRPRIRCVSRLRCAEMPLRPENLVLAT